MDFCWGGGTPTNIDKSQRPVGDADGSDNVIPVLVNEVCTYVQLLSLLSLSIYSCFFFHYFLFFLASVLYTYMYIVYIHMYTFLVSVSNCGFFSLTDYKLFSESRQMYCYRL